MGSPLKPGNPFSPGAPGKPRKIKHMRMIIYPSLKINSYPGIHVHQQGRQVLVLLKYEMMLMYCSYNKIYLPGKPGPGSPGSPLSPGRPGIPGAPSERKHSK